MLKVKWFNKYKQNKMKKVVISAILLLSLSGAFAQKKKAVKDSVAQTVKIDSVLSKKLDSLAKTEYVCDEDFKQALQLIQKQYANVFTLERYNQTLEVFELVRQVANQRKQRK